MSQIYRKVAILGLGIEGAALAQFLVDKSSVVEVFDEKTSQQLLNNAEKDLSVQISDVLKNEKIIKNLNSKIENLTISDFDIIFRSPSVYFAHEKLLEARSKGVKISSQIKLFFELCPCKIVGVTGTKGKGTTASLVYEILKKFTDSSKDRKVYLAGNIGYPAISLISKLKQDDIVVLELSNFQLADLDRSPHIAVVTNIGVDHLDYHKSYDEYVRAKLNILKHQANDDYAILNYHSTFPGELVDNFSGQKLYFSKQEENFEGVKAYVHLGETGRNEVVFRSQTDEIKICDEKSIKLVGRHNLENIAAATLAAKILGVPEDLITSVANSFVGLPYRLENVKEIGGIRFINDSFATNPGPTMAAIDSFKEDKILILGGSSKNADFTELAEKITKSNVKAVVLMGQERFRIEKALALSGYQGQIFMEQGDLIKVVQRAKTLAKQGDIVIFSPACASFDMFKNYKDRGAKFREAVQGLEL